MEACRCKVAVNRIIEERWPYRDSVTGEMKASGEGVTVELTAQYDQTLKEDQSFSKATPSATFTMRVDNPAAIEFFRRAKYFYADFSPAE